jgi:pimeloyl-ACP methyl ester carboxylesterase
MRTYVLVHGAFAGGWMWRELANDLRRRGHEVYTPTLTGLGERVHLATPATNLTTHIEDVLNVIRYEELNDIVLAGFSYGGMVISGVADRIPDRIAHLVYIDAELPLDGENEVEATGEEEWAKWDSIFVKEGWRTHMRIPSLSAEESARYERLEGQPTASFEEPVRLQWPVEQQPFSRTFIAATDSAAPKSIARVRDNAAWRFFELPGGHSLHRDAPDQLASLLHDLA